MELPTYTNIWKIEKRLYKLYDFRLPIPLPIGLLTAFLAIAVPYMLILTLAGMPFSHTWVWLYVLPPGVLAWLVNRPVLEGKRLPELVLSQLRYLAEPRVWCRMAPVAEKDRVIVVAQVWRGPARLAVAGPAAAVDQAAVVGLPAGAGLAGAELAGAELAGAAESAACAGSAADLERTAQPATPARQAGPAWPHRPAVRAPAAGTAEAVPAADADADSAAAAVNSAAAALGRPAATARAATGSGRSRARAPGGPGQPREPRRSPGAGPPVVTIQAGAAVDAPLHVVERALRTSPARAGTGWHDRVLVVPGGHRPGKPDYVQRDQARARLPVPGPARIVVLGTTAGAGQTVTVLLTGQLLSSLRGEAVAVVDLSAGPGSLTERARQIPRLLPGRQPGSGAGARGQGGPARDRALQVVTAAEDAGTGPRDAGQLIDAVCARYPLTIADPPAADVPRALHAADQLVLVSPAGAEGAGSLAMTLEWLEAHDHAALVQSAVTVLNGVSAQTTVHAERAASVAAGRSRAVVRVPWDAGLSDGGALGAETVRAYAALAGVLISGLAEAGPGAAPPTAAAPARQVSR